MYKGAAAVTEVDARNENEKVRGGNLLGSQKARRCTLPEEPK